MLQQKAVGVWEFTFGECLACNSVPLCGLNEHAQISNMHSKPLTWAMCVGGQPSQLCVSMHSPYGLTAEQPFKQGSKSSDNMYYVAVVRQPVTSRSQATSQATAMAPSPRATLSSNRWQQVLAGRQPQIKQASNVDRTTPHSCQLVAVMQGQDWTCGDRLTHSAVHGLNLQSSATAFFSKWRPAYVYA